MVKCDEAMRAVTLAQSVPGGGKQSVTRTYHFDKVPGRQWLVFAGAVGFVRATQHAGWHPGSPCCPCTAGPGQRAHGPLLGHAALQVFGPDTTQERLYATAVSSIVTEVLEGFNCTIFACECGGRGPAGPCAAASSRGDNWPAATSGGACCCPPMSGLLRVGPVLQTARRARARRTP